MSKNRHLKKYRIYLDVTFDDLCLLKNGLQLLCFNESRLLFLPSTSDVRTVKRDRSRITKINRVVRLTHVLESNIRAIFNV